MAERVGYWRVSTDGQSLDDQIAALKAAGATKLFAEKPSGARSDRPQLRKAINALGAGDVLLVTRLDRLVRSTRDLLNVLHEVGEKGAAFRSLADSMGGYDDTARPLDGDGARRIGRVRALPYQSAHGCRREAGAPASVRFGRPPKLTRHQQEQALKLLDQGEPQSAVARLLNCDQSTISRLAARSAT